MYNVNLLIYSVLILVIAALYLNSLLYYRMVERQVSQYTFWTHTLADGSCGLILIFHTLSIHYPYFIYVLPIHYLYIIYGFYRV